MTVGQLIVLCGVFLIINVVRSDSEQFHIPEATIETFRPRGIRVSIPDYPGIRLFAFHGVVNRDLNGLEAGDMSGDIVKATNGRWVFVDTTIKLNPGDVLNYWLFVVRENLGFRLDNQKLYVNNLQDAPPGFITDNPRPYRTTTRKPGAYPEYVPGSVTQQPPACNCPAQTIPPITIIPPICIQNPAHQNAPSQATTTLRPAAGSSSELGLWREILVNLSTENAEFRDKIQVLKDINEVLLGKLQKAGDDNLNKLILGGKISRQDAPFPIVMAVLKEKLGFVESKILKSAVRNEDGSITFELTSFDDKIHVLLLSKTKLQGSKVTIKDIDTISFLNPDTNQPLIDMRGNQ